MKLSKSSDVFVSEVFLSGSSTRDYKEKIRIKSNSIVGNDSEGAIDITGGPRVLIAMSWPIEEVKTRLKFSVVENSASAYWFLGNKFWTSFHQLLSYSLFHLLVVYFERWEYFKIRVALVARSFSGVFSKIILSLVISFKLSFADCLRPSLLLSSMVKLFLSSMKSLKTAKLINSIPEMINYWQTNWLWS